MKEYSDCTAVREEFSGLLDGELTPDEREGIEAHLAECSDCLRELDSIKRVDGLYADMAPVSAPVGFEQSVREALRPNVVPMKRSGVNTRVWGGALAMAATIALVAGLTLWPSPKEDKRFNIARVASETPQAKSTPAKSEFLADEDRAEKGLTHQSGAKRHDARGVTKRGTSEDVSVPFLAPAQARTEDIALAPSEADARLGDRVGVAQSYLSGRADSFDDSAADMRQVESNEAGAGFESADIVGGLKKETKASKMLLTAEILDETSDEPAPLDADRMEPESGRRERLGRDAETQRFAEAAQRELEEAPTLDRIESKDKVARHSGVVGGAVLEPVFEQTMNEEEAFLLREADEAARADALKRDLNRESITENGSTFRPDTPLPPSTPMAQSRPAAVQGQGNRQAKAKSRSRVLRPREAGAAPLRSFEERDDVWYEIGYRGEDLMALDPDSPEMQRIVAENADLAEILSWRAKVVFQVKGAWYALNAPDGSPR